MAQITEASERPILKSKIFLYITEFFSGMSIYFISIKAKRIACVVSAVIFVAILRPPLTGFAFWETNTASSIYNYLQVKNLSGTILSTNVLFGVQSVTMKDKGLTGMYYDTAQLRRRSPTMPIPR